MAAQTPLLDEMSVQAPLPDNQAPRYSVVVPVYNSDHSVVELVERLRSVFEKTLHVRYEIILVDDGSHKTDTWKTLEKLVEEHPTVTAIQLMRNFGKSGAVLCGLQHVRGRWVITIDDDLQQWPEDIPELIKQEEHDVVVAHFTARKDRRSKKLTSWIKSQFDRIILGLPCKMSPFKLFKAEVAREMLKIQSNHPFIPALMAYVTKDFVPVSVRHSESRHGKSRYTSFLRFKKFLNLLIGNSSLLLRVVGIVGVLASLSGFAFAFYVIMRKVLGSTIEPGWASLVVINLVFCGLILIALSIIGEYLIRLLEGSNQKPPYIIRRVIGNRETDKTVL